jgi:hypothetical protein
MTKPADEQRPATNFLVERARLLGYVVPEFVSQFTPYLDMVAQNRRYKRVASVHHTPRVNGSTGQPHSGSREAQRRQRQQGRAARRDEGR